MKILLGLGVAAVGALGMPAAAGAAAITYDCDTAANHYSELVLPAPAGPFTVTGNVKLNAIAASTDYIPVARVRITTATPPGKSADAAGFSLSAVPTKALPDGATAVQMLSWNVTGKDDEALPFSMFAKPGTVQPFRLTYDSGNVAVMLGTEAKTLRLKAAEPVVQIVCSTGEFLFTDVVIQAGR